MDTVNEFVIEWLRGDDTAKVTAPASSALCTRIRKLSREHPENVTIIAENKDGSIFAEIPVKYVSIRHPRKVSEEQRRAAAERMVEYHEQKTKNGLSS